MDIFTTVKAAVTLRQAAEHYGLQVRRNGMTCCPFHDDRHPSMKLNERYFYCFGCGDVYKRQVSNRGEQHPCWHTIFRRKV